MSDELVEQWVKLVDSMVESAKLIRRVDAELGNSGLFNDKPQGVPFAHPVRTGYNGPA